MRMRDQSDPAYFTADAKVRSAWLYFVEGLTQEQIAQALGITRLKVMRLLAAARTDGTVRIRIDAKSASQVEYERALAHAFGLETVIVVPSPGEDANAAALIGYAAGQWLAGEMRDGLSIAVGWGNTLSLALRGMEARAYKGASVISLMGGMTHSRAINPSAVARRVADMFGADCYQLTAPIFVSGPETRDALLAEPGLCDLLDRACRSDLALISTGDLTTSSTLAREGLISKSDLVSLRSSGAVADVLCHVIDAHGREVDHPVNRRVMAVGLDVLRRIPRVAIASGGPAKAAAIRAAIRASGAKILITDEAAARAILQPGAPMA
ncbi:MAG: sugar-binding transcriptional regulator [Hyphomicrobiaceae bacterium]|nr:MAG: sugar-binding transcriptional regulator [Hyphomicrobiaceae bacterium]